jgi:hypothetical protein
MKSSIKKSSIIGDTIKKQKSSTIRRPRENRKTPKKKIVEKYKSSVLHVTVDSARTHVQYVENDNVKT